ncbi:DUF1800 domain-containing protein [Nocardioides abyssi]|uniref:DUF1800 domain-containing protein n=1 Tax=Nocardioides abyssi TaxID=3058370 RepID=A0ABT8EPF8_9ACTN|nr:DUF1800 domain-containing protein [Nocardioides abyssi]MDN4160015.1 DUF1800 domain-containing protein [Nocardioides abyssi]
MTTPAPRWTRRAAVTGSAAAAGTAVATLATAAPASAAPATAAARRYKPARYTRTRVLAAGDRHVAARFSYGLTPALEAEVTAAGGGRAWFGRQLDTAYDGAADGVADWWPDLHLSPTQLLALHTSGRRAGWRVMQDYGRRHLARRILSPRPVLEKVAEFFENHLHVPADGNLHCMYRVQYGEVIRKHALGRFDDMLVAATTHPAMLVYLDGATSTKKAPNENLGRELLELHTVGVGAFTEDDVKSSARILTGWRVDVGRTWAHGYLPADHWTGPVQVLGFRDANASSDGKALCERYLRYLAHHPATARHLARELVVKFVRDDAPQGLVDRLAKVYLDHDTAIRPVLEALVASPEFAASADAKLRDPGEDVVVSHRVLGTTIARPLVRDDTSMANLLAPAAALVGQAPFTWPAPNGQPHTNAFWGSPARAMASFYVHWTLAGAGGTGVTYRPMSAWLPQTSITFDLWVDHLSRVLHHRPSTAELLQACCEATGVAPTERVTRTHRLMQRAQGQRLLAVFLDHPAHFHH